MSKINNVALCLLDVEVVTEINHNNLCLFILWSKIA